ncbi:hypothetical protein Cgig2_015890 [Carnegiea gigantea]|uniref:Aminotransferase-like plant mobile domain-containing protein n=1 Tax=Carnegiea gigantea TaxID=171969 RepID=A0A9Q1GKN0_9CARY|nr:hypothetical protein Cgig2_015890 [Carnegiea gigantea]
MQGRKGKPTIEQWIASWFRGCNRYHIARKPDQDSRIPHPRILSSIIDAGARGWGYCLPTAILTSIYKGLNEISRSSHPDRGGGYFPIHFLYAWLAKNFDVYELVGETSSSLGMVKFSAIGQAKSFQLEEARELIDLDFDNLPDPKIMLRYHQTLVRYGTSPHTSDSKKKRSDLFDTNTSKDECELGSKPKLKVVRSGKPLEPSVPPMGDGSSYVKIPGIDVVIPAMSIPAIPIQSIAPLLQGESDDVNFKEELAHVPLPSGSQCFSSIGRIPSFGNNLFDGTLRLVDSPGVCSLDDDEVESIRRVNAPLLVSHPQRSLRAPQGGIFVFNVEAVIKEVDKAILDKVCCTPFDGLPSLKGNFDSLYATILQRGVHVTPLESKVEGLIKQVCDFKDLQQSYSGRTAAKEHDTCRMEVQGKLDEASRWLNTKGAHYEAKMVELKHVESRRQELLKELQLLEEQQKDLHSQAAASKHLLQEAERKVIDLQG